MKGEKRISLFQWFAQALARDLATSSPTPAEILRHIGAPVSWYPWIHEVRDDVLPLVERNGELLPDLESRARGEKRLKGQYFTPETLVKTLFALTGIPGSGHRLLDPACGDGGFLVPAALLQKDNAFKPRPDIPSVSTPSVAGNFWGFDLDPQALLICLARLVKIGAGWPHLLCRDFLLDPPKEKFDAVLGNPPYRVNLPEVLRQQLQDKYSTAEGEKDLYTFFLEGAVRALKSGGEALMLTSHTYLVNHQCSRLRSFLFGEHDVKNLFLLPYNFFPMARGVLPSILHVANRPPGKIMTIHDRFDGKGAWKVTRQASPAVFLRPTGLREALRDTGSQELLLAMAAVSRPMGEIAKIGVGIQESTIRGSQISSFVCNEKRGDDYVPVLRGKEIQPFKTLWEGKFLHYGPHLTYAGDPSIFQGLKILYQNIRNESLPRRLVGALDLEGFYPKNSLSYICRPIEPFSLEYLLGLFNSPLLNFWFREHFFSFHVTVTQVRQLPIAVGTEESRRKVEALVKRISSGGPEKLLPSDHLLSDLSESVIKCYFPDGKADEVAALLRSSG